MSGARVSVRVRDADLAILSTPLYVDFVLIGFFLLLLLRLALVLRSDSFLLSLFTVCFAGTIIFSKIIAHVASSAGQCISKCRTGLHVPQDCRDPLHTRLKQRKFADQAWQIAIHASMTFCEIYLLFGKTWLNNPASCFEPCPSEYAMSVESTELESGASDVKQQHELELRVFYILQLAIWVWTGFSCCALESRRKDYVEMMLHHNLTVMCILCSFINGELAIGLVVLFVHDCSDIVLDLMKMFNYLKLEDSHGWFLTEITFGLNLMSWMYFRLYYFPVYVLYYGSYSGYAANCGDDDLSGTLDRCLSAGSCFQSGLGLFLLSCLHWVWFYMLLRIAYKLLCTKKSSSQIGREEYEGQSESDNENKEN